MRCSELRSAAGPQQPLSSWPRPGRAPSTTLVAATTMLLAQELGSSRTHDLQGGHAETLALRCACGVFAAGARFLLDPDVHLDAIGPRGIENHSTCVSAWRFER